MPSLVTHMFAAEDALQRCGQSLLAEIVAKYPQAFFIGSSGPDFLFFYCFWPWMQDKKTKQMFELGNQMHSTHINEVFGQALRLVKNSTVHREEMISYMAGWLCHYALDRNAHPFIFYFSGFGTNESSNHHRRMEAMIDSLMIQQKRCCDIRKCKPQDVVKRGSHTHEAMSELLTPILQDVFGITVTEHDILKSLKDMKLLYTILYDPYGWKFPLLKKLEKVPYSFTGTLIKRKFFDRDESYDVMNEQHLTWVHPCDNTLISQETFLDVYEKGVADGAALLALFGEYLNDHIDLSPILDVIGDRTYDTGMNHQFPMKYSSDKYAI